MLTRAFKTAPRRPRETTEPPKDARERPKSLKNLGKINVFGISYIFAFNGLLRPQDGPKRRPRGPKMAPRGLQMALRWR